MSLGPLLVALATCLYKAVLLGSAMSAGSPRTMAGIALEDVPFLALVAVLAMVARGRVPAVRLLALLAAFVANVLYIVDAWALTTLDNHVSLDRVIVFAGDLKTVISFLDLQHAAILAGVVLLHVGAWWGRGRVLGPALAAVTIGAIAAVAGQGASERYREYAFPPRSQFAEAEPARVRPEFDAAEIAAARAVVAGRPRVRLPKPGLNLVLVIVESLSTRDSRRAGGFSDVVPRFDELSKNGTLFPNTIANYDLSEGGIIALLSGTAPIPFPRSGRSLFLSFAPQGSVVEELAAAGYRTRVISAFSLKFQDMDEYLHAIGVEQASDGDSHPLLKDAPRFVLGAPSDEALFDAGLAEIDTLDDGGVPYLLVLMTATSHPPWTDPRGVNDGPAEVWAFVDEQLERLYRGLDDRGFFDDGLLVIIGDHRQASVVSDDELARFGPRAHALVPMAVIGAGIPRGVVDPRFVQQSDVFRALADVADPKVPLSPNPLNVTAYTRGFEELDRVGLVEVFPESGRQGTGRSYVARVYGASFAWVGDAPPDAAAIERQVQAERAVHQATAMREARDCPWELEGTLAPGTGSGMLVGDYDAGLRDPRRLAPRAKPTIESVATALQVVPQAEISATAVRVARAFLRVPRPGTYWFQVQPPYGVCVRVDGIPVVRPDEAWWNTFHLELSEGLHELSVIRPAGVMGRVSELRWRGPEQTDFTAIPVDAVVAPAAVEVGP